MWPLFVLIPDENLTLKKYEYCNDFIFPKFHGDVPAMGIIICLVVNASCTKEGPRIFMHCLVPTKTKYLMFHVIQKKFLWNLTQTG